MAFYKMVMEKIAGPEGAFLHGMDKKGEKGGKEPPKG